MKVKFKENEKNQYVTLELTDMEGKKFEAELHAYIWGLLASIKLRIDNGWHGVLIITGDVGDGKSSLAALITAVWEKMQNRQVGYNNIVWRTLKFIELTDLKDNFGHAIWWDEAIDGATGKASITKEGTKLKNAMVTKRLKRHLYVLLIDEIEEYSWKFVKMCNAWIHVKAFGIQRGYFNAYVKRHKIRQIYTEFKKNKKDWDSFEIKKIRPDCRGKYGYYFDRFFDTDEYDNKKIDETRQIEESQQESKGSNRGAKITKEMMEAKKLNEGGTSVKDIAMKYNVNPKTVYNWFDKIKAVGIVI